MGLLDAFQLPQDPDRNQAARMGLLNFGAALMGSRSPNFGTALGQGLLAGGQGYQQAFQNAGDAEMRQLQLAEARRKAATQDSILRAAQGAMRPPEEGGGFNQDAFMNQLWSVAPLQAMEWQSKFKKDTPFAKVDPKDYTRESVAKFAVTGNPADLVPVRPVSFVNGQAVDAYNTAPGTRIDQIDPNQPFAMIGNQIVPNKPYQDYSINKARAGASNVNVTTRQESEEAKTVGKGLGEIYLDLQKSGQSASGKIARLDRLGSLLDGVNTGKLTPIGTEVAALASSIGFSIDPKLANKQAVDALSNEIALQMRNPSGGAGMPGALSDKDREFLVKTVPGLGKDPGANKLIVETMKKLAQREQDVARLAREYRKRNGSLDEGFYDELEKFANANPLFQDISTSSNDGWGIKPVSK